MRCKTNIWNKYIQRFRSCGLRFCFLQPRPHLLSSVLQAWAPRTRSSSRATAACAPLRSRSSPTRRWWTTRARRRPTTRRSCRSASSEQSSWRSWCPPWWPGLSTATTTPEPASQPAWSPGRPSHLDASALSATLTKKILLCKRSDCLYL